MQDLILRSNPSKAADQCAKLGNDLYNFLNPSRMVSAARHRRLIDIDFKVEDVKLKHRFDIDRMLDRVDKLFLWHESEKEQNEYMAPYFPMIQSSGSGKTKLLHEIWQQYQRNKKRNCIMLICRNGNGDNTLPEPIYSKHLSVRTCLLYTSPSPRD